MAENSEKKQSVGILAYGSLISDPGDEIDKARTEIIDNVVTPFQIEFARTSGSRGGAPTLVPVASGGANVKGQVFVMGVSEAQATDMLYRREIRQVSKLTKRYQRPDRVTKNTVLVERLTNFAGLKVVLYTKIGANIDPLTPLHLAELAISSVPKAPLDLDGISYLIAAKSHGIKTALSSAYEAELLRMAGCASLEDARAKLREESRG